VVFTRFSVIFTRWLNVCFQCYREHGRLRRTQVAGIDLLRKNSSGTQDWFFFGGTQDFGEERRTGVVVRAMEGIKTNGGNQNL
jgi:hypothetical protein